MKRFELVEDTIDSFFEGF